jgi:hypothetical protein
MLVAAYRKNVSASGVNVAFFRPLSNNRTCHYRNLKHCQYGAMRIRFYDTVPSLFTNWAICL